MLATLVGRRDRISMLCFQDLILYETSEMNILHVNGLMCQHSDFRSDMRGYTVPEYATYTLLIVRFHGRLLLTDSPQLLPSSFVSRNTAAVYPDFPVLAWSAVLLSQQFAPTPVSYLSRNCELITIALHVSFVWRIALYWLQASTHCSRVYAVNAIIFGSSNMLVLSRQL
jgi:hypothetical protein